MTSDCMAPVAGKHLVTALTRQQDLEAVVASVACNEPRQLVRGIGEQVSASRQRLWRGMVTRQIRHGGPETRFEFVNRPGVLVQVLAQRVGGPFDAVRALDGIGSRPPNQAAIDSS